MPSILEGLDAALESGATEQIGEIVGAFYRLAAEADAATLNAMLASLDARIEAHPIELVGNVAMLAGALVELGADPGEFPLSVFDHLLEQLEALSGPEDETELPEAYDLLERAAMACLSRSPKLRRELPQKQELLDSFVRYDERYGFLGKMIQVLDDEPLVVIHPSTSKGFRFRIHGIADNFQLHLLLLGALAGTHIKGIVPTPGSLAAARDSDSESADVARSDWQLANWQGLRQGGTIAGMDDTDTWIWNEGVPADIARFDATRLVLIGPSSIERSWNAGRIFSGMPGRLVGPELMSASEVSSLLGAIEARLGH